MCLGGDYPFVRLKIAGIWSHAEYHNAQRSRRLPGNAASPHGKPLRRQAGALSAPHLLERRTKLAHARCRIEEGGVATRLRNPGSQPGKALRIAQQSYALPPVIIGIRANQ